MSIGYFERHSDEFFQMDQPEVSAAVWAVKCAGNSLLWDWKIRHQQAGGKVIVTSDSYFDTANEAAAAAVGVMRAYNMPCVCPTGRQSDERVGI